MQRLVAASALTCGRQRAMVSDLWVFHHVWDTLEQREVLAALVQDVLKQASPAPQDHPRSAGGRPDAEDLARDLNQLGKRLTDSQTSEAERATLKDRLTLLGARVQWVADDKQRQYLQGMLDGLWKEIGGGKP